jgi:hypothetical protein
MKRFFGRAVGGDSGLGAGRFSGRSNLSALNKEAQASRRSQPPHPLWVIRSMQPAIMLLALQIMSCALS